MTRYLLSLCLMLALVPAAHAQMGFNSPAGVTPRQDFEVYSLGSFIVQQKYKLTTTNPQASTATIHCGPFETYRDTQAGIMTDPSNYSTYSATTEYNCSQKVWITSPPPGETIVGIEITFLQFDLGPDARNRDYLTISSPSVTSIPPFFGTTLPGRIVIPDNEFTIRFWGTPDGTGGRGFRLQWRALYADNTPATSLVSTPNTNQLQFNTQTGALLAGVPPDYRGWTLGAGSVSLGDKNRAVGVGSAAIGRENTTGSGFDGFGNGIAAMALGYSNFASGDRSAAIGDDNYTIGTSSIAIGYRNRPSKDFGVAIGNTNAAGFNAIALGFTNGAGGDYAVGIGRNNTAGAPGGVAIGAYNYVPTSTTNSVAIGQYNHSTGYASMAFGTSVSAGGTNAMALGLQNTASGPTALAMGRGNTASGPGSTAMGSVNTASGDNATVMGNSNTASGAASTAMGLQNTASGLASTAMGYLNIASGNYSTAMGHRMNTNNQAGAFMIGDTDPLGQGSTGAGTADQFVARFRNGYYFMTSGTSTRTGVFAGAGQNAWGSISDSTKKERLLPMNHADVLRKIGGMKLSSWNYKGQREIRHYGPMAQDFYAAFGNDGLGQIGCDTLIYSHDFAGVTFAGVQALIRENERLRVETQNLRAETQNLRAETQNFASQLADMNARLKLLEGAAIGRKQVVSRRK
ncbi:MAG: hypothetical protein EAZ91_08405 [Cytophagales bacterium]|nr:MAG: hypothetical protein EAZ91_08405 [Cytophagales bacterium]